MLGLLLLAGTLLGTAVGDTRVTCDATSDTIYQFNSTNLDGEIINLSDYQGKVVLIYNVATYCGLTIPSYNQINAIADQYDGQDLVILGYPCNQFDLQEPAANAEELMNGITYVRPGGGFVPKLTQIFEKCDVNGADEIPLYTYLKDTCGPTYKTYNSLLFYSPMRIGDILWNFEKFLIDRKGVPYTRYNPSIVDVDTIAADIDVLLAQEA